MVRTMSESMMRRVAGRCGAHRHRPHREHGSTGPRVHGSTAPRVHGHGKGPPPGEAGEGPFPCPEPVVVTSPSILTHTKEPHLRSSNLNFFSPTIGVRFSFGREGGRHLAAGAKEKAGRGISSPARPFYWPTVALLPVPRGLGLVSATAEQHQSHSQERERGQRHGGRGYAGLGELANRLHDGRGRRWNVGVGELGSGSGDGDHAGGRGRLVPDGIPPWSCRPCRSAWRWNPSSSRPSGRIRLWRSDCLAGRRPR